MEDQLTFKFLGRISYQDALAVQEDERKNIGDKLGTVFFLEHHPIITYGKSKGKENLLSESDIEIVETNRGGDITYHGPGQLVCYPIINLKKIKTDVHWYMRTLEKIIIEYLSTLNIIGFQIEGKTGVWVNDDKKIASIGVHFSRWVSMHGFSLNLKKVPPFGFDLINPCGFKSESIEWVENFAKVPDLLAASSSLFTIIEKKFSVQGSGYGGAGLPA